MRRTVKILGKVYTYTTKGDESGDIKIGTSAQDSINNYELVIRKYHRKRAKERL